MSTCGRRLARSHRGVEGAECENLYYKLFVEMNKEVNVRHPSGNRRAMTFWKVRDARERGDEYFEQVSEQTILKLIRKESLDKHLQHQALALTEALRRVDVKGIALAHRRQEDAGVKWTLPLSFSGARRGCSDVNCTFVFNVR